MYRCRRSEPCKVVTANWYGNSWIIVAFLCSVGGPGISIPLFAQNPITVSIVPVGGSGVSGGQLVAVEVFLAANLDIQIATGETDLPCLLPGQAGAVGTIDAQLGTIDPQGDGIAGPSINGTPYLLGPGSIGPYSPVHCSVLHILGVSGGPADLSAGDVRYLGTFFYLVSDCAIGEFDLFLEWRTEFRLNAIEAPIIPMDVENSFLVVSGGSCCLDGECLLDAVNEFCCQQSYPGGRWFEGRTCEEAIPCPCLADEDCSDGVFCNGVERCQTSTGHCQAGAAPDCDDGVDCTVDSCNTALDACARIPSPALCDDGIYCNGEESCHSSEGCRMGKRPCLGSAVMDGGTVFLDCDETADSCVIPPIPAASTWGLVVLALLLLSGAKVRAMQPETNDE